MRSCFVRLGWTITDVESEGRFVWGHKPDNTVSDSNFFTAAGTPFRPSGYFPSSQGVVQAAIGGYIALWRAIGGLWRTAPGDDENYVYAIAL
jgi:hypothetical protein